MKTSPIPYRHRHDIAMNCIATPRGGKWCCCNFHGIEVYRSVTLGLAERVDLGLRVDLGSMRAVLGSENLRPKRGPNSLGGGDGRKKK